MTDKPVPLAVFFIVSLTIIVGYSMYCLIRKSLTSKKGLPEKEKDLVNTLYFDVENIVYFLKKNPSKTYRLVFSSQSTWQDFMDGLHGRGIVRAYPANMDKKNLTPSDIVHLNINEIQRMEL